VQNNYPILLADPELADCCQAEDVLIEAGYQVVHVENCYHALDALYRMPFVLAILAVDLPGEPGGLNVCRRVRQNHEMPVIMVAGANCEREVMDAFSAGASDCVVRPVRREELLARVRVLLSRLGIQQSEPQRIIRYEGLTLDTGMRAISRGGEVLPLSPIEFRMLHFFMSHPGEIIRKEDLLRSVWGYQVSTGDLNLVESAVRRLRKLIEADPNEPACLQTIWGVGYRFGDLIPK
jgi:DNA-binding response OmpR family regulator